MDLDQLRAFVAVAEAGGFTRAAQVLASTQPTLSRQVKALERELGRPLFDRLGRRVVLTAFGKEIESRGRQLLSMADGLVASAQQPAGRLVGELRLGVADSVVFSRLPPVLERFKRRHMDVQLHIETGSSPEILAWVRRGRCDAGLCMLPRAHPGLALRPLWADRFVAIVQPCHAMADCSVALEEFASQRLIIIRPGTLSHQVLTAAYQTAGLSLLADMDFDTFHLIAEFVAAGVGVGICSETVARPFLEEGRVARVAIEPIDALERSLGLVIHADRAPSGPLAAFLDELDRAVADGASQDRDSQVPRRQARRRGPVP